MRFPLARDPNRRTLRRRTECRAAFARAAAACIDSCSPYTRNPRALLLRANAADRRPIRREAARPPETHGLAGAVHQTLQLKPVACAMGLIVLVADQNPL